MSIKEASHKNVLALLEYLYTDHAPIEDGDAVGIMVLADRFCLPRLVNLCELYITKEVAKSGTQNGNKSGFNVIRLLLTAQVTKNGKYAIITPKKVI